MPKLYCKIKILISRLIRLKLFKSLLTLSILYYKNEICLATFFFILVVL